jgi:hypothetical protein
MAENLQSESLNALLRELAMSLKALTNDETSLQELDNTLDIARELHERIAILRFRAIEKLADPTSQGEVPQEEQHATTEESTGTFERPFSFSIRTEATATPAIPPEPVAPLPSTDEPSDAEETPSPLALEPQIPAAAIEPETHPMSLADRLQLAPLDQLADAMGINDRVRFAQELFGGDMGAFKAACTAIESDASESAGLATLQSLADPEVDWTAEKGAAADFSILVSRLFVGKPS